MDEAELPLIDYGHQIKPVTSKVSKPVLCSLAFILLLFICVIFQVYFADYNNTFARILSVNVDEGDFEFNETLENAYLVNSLKCKIPNTNPFNIEAKQYFKTVKYVPCSKLELLSYITKNDNIATLHIDTEMAPSYSKYKIICCYSNITRERRKGSPDDYIKISKCRDFHDNVTVPQEYVMIKCHTELSKKTIYENTHATIPIKPSVKSRVKPFKENSTNPYSVLLVGIDSISRLNLIRTLPATYRFLEDNNWISLKGYNKMGDNTFPNLMAILTGFNMSQAYQICAPTKSGHLDQCPFVWKYFHELGYVTAYAEDEASINTFNYKKKGFDQQPTDYYFRPLMLASEKMKTVRRDSLTYCVGPETYGEKIMNLAKNFASSFKNYPSFGFFWMNTFSHNDVNEPGMMDKKIRMTLQDVSESVEDSIVIFLSDHGIRFGDIRYTHTGWLEERLPFVYILIPKRFQLQFPTEFKNLKRNANKLTTPYDLHMTLQHILTLSNLNHTIKPSLGCPNCTSMFNEIEADRGCEEVGVAQHWCTCSGYTSIGLNRTLIEKTRDYVVMQLKNLTSGYKSCAEFSVKKVRSVAMSEPNSFNPHTYVLIVIETMPKAFFEATVSYEYIDANNSHLQLQSSISRLDSYASHSNCVGDEFMKKYCYCR